MARLSYDDWVRRGLDILAEEGAEALKIDRLCKRLNVTKGSFYHHFQNREAFVQALLDHWEHSFTDDIIDQANRYARGEDRSKALNRITASMKQDTERAVRAWAQWNPLVADRVERIDRKRLAYLGEIIAPLVQVPERAPLIAKLAYAHFLGVQQLRANVTAEEWRQMDALLLQLFTAPELKSMLEDAQ